MSSETFASVWDAIEDTPAEAENMKLRSASMMALKDRIERARLSQTRAAKFFLASRNRAFAICYAARSTSLVSTPS